APIAEQRNPSGRPERSRRILLILKSARLLADDRPDLFRGSPDEFARSIDVAELLAYSDFGESIQKAPCLVILGWNRHLGRPVAEAPLLAHTHGRQPVEKAVRLIKLGRDDALAGFVDISSVAAVLDIRQPLLKSECFSHPDGDRHLPGFIGVSPVC